ncbi:MAG: hypothetical protein UHK60_08980 [Acutalibacteraceae bacterium]|nr:hypothetical protein [Acutalibacteraceae bacterium]
MNKEDFITWVNLNEQVFALARARMKTKKITEVSYNFANNKVYVFYIPEKALSRVPECKIFELSDFVGE